MTTESVWIDVSVRHATDIDAIEARLLGHCPPLIPDGATDCTAGLQFKADVAALIAEILRLRKALEPQS